MKLLSIWGGGLWFLPVLTTLATIYFGYLTYKQWNSGSRTYDKGKVINEDAGKMPLYKLSYFYFTVIGLIATIIIVISVNSDK